MSSYNKESVEQVIKITLTHNIVSDILSYIKVIAYTHKLYDRSFLLTIRNCV